MRGGRIAAPLYPTEAPEICAKHPRKAEKQLGFLAITLYGMRHSRHGIGWALGGCLGSLAAYEPPRVLWAKAD